jgi:hypothetical protein
MRYEIQVLVLVRIQGVRDIERISLRVRAETVAQAQAQAQAQTVVAVAAADLLMQREGADSEDRAQ